MSELIDPNTYTVPYQLTKTVHRKQYHALSPLAPENSQKGKIVVITGGGTGIGAAAAEAWAQAGAAKIVLAARRIEKLEKVAASLKITNVDVEVLVVKVDVTVETDVANLFNKIQDVFGRPADVVLSNAGSLSDALPIGSTNPLHWWKSLEVNVRGEYLVLNGYIKSLGDNPDGTFIVVSSGISGAIAPGSSSYSISKLAQQRLIEYADAEYSNLRVFTLHPGIVQTELTDPDFVVFALDEIEMGGQLSLYLAQKRADYLRGSFVSVNWDVTEMEAHKEEIEHKKLLKMSWLPILPIGGGSGLP